MLEQFLQNKKIQIHLELLLIFWIYKTLKYASGIYVFQSIKKNIIIIVCNIIFKDDNNIILGEIKPIYMQLKRYLQK